MKAIIITINLLENGRNGIQMAINNLKENILMI
jgi:hypothetical protein